MTDKMDRVRELRRQAEETNDLPTLQAISKELCDLEAVYSALLVAKKILDVQKAQAVK